jgi:hypothetical protein
LAGTEPLTLETRNVNLVCVLGRNGALQ